MNFLLRIHILHGRRSASVYENIGRCPAGHVVRCPAGVVRDQPDTFAIILHKKQVIRKFEASPDKRAPLELYDINLKQKSSGACLMCANADRAPYGARLILHEFSRVMINTFILTFSIILHKKQVIKIREFEASPDKREPLESYDTNLKQKSSGARPICANAVRCPADVILS